MIRPLALLLVARACIALAWTCAQSGLVLAEAGYALHGQANALMTSAVRLRTEISVRRKIREALR